MNVVTASKPNSIPMNPFVNPSAKPRNPNNMIFEIQTQIQNFKAQIQFHNTNPKVSHTAQNLKMIK
jgi:hypothetical protein